MKIDEETIVLDGVTYWRLYIKCPVCFDNARYVQDSFWYHKQCGGDIYLGGNLKLLCKKCGWSIDVRKAKFNCPIHCECDENTVESSTQFTNYFPIPILARMVQHVGSIAFLQELLKNL